MLPKLFLVQPQGRLKRMGEAPSRICKTWCLFRRKWGVEWKEM